VGGCDKREPLTWESRSLIGCLYEFQRNTDAVCALIVQDDAAILAKVSTMANFDVDTLGVFSSIMFATSRILVREHGTDGEVWVASPSGLNTSSWSWALLPKLLWSHLAKRPSPKGFSNTRRASWCLG
jgi:hypothetical protein